MILQISFIPFDIGFAIDLSEPAPQTLRGFRFFEEQDREINGLLGTDLLTFESDDGRFRFYLNIFGFCVLRIQTNAYDDILDAPTVGKILYDRRNTHCEIIKGTHSINRQIKKFKNEIERIYPLRKRKSMRPIFWQNCPYVMSVYFIKEPRGFGQTETDRKRALAALIEPSIVDAEDTPFLEIENNPTQISEIIKKLRIGNYKDSLQDYDISDQVQAFISWANVVVAVKTDELLEDTIKIYSSLEVRLQLAWVMSFYINEWRNLALEKEVRWHEVEETKWNLVRIHRTTTNLLDASIGTRYQTIFEKLIETSGLIKQINEARDGLDLASQYVDFIRERREARYRIIVEICLFIFGFCQLVPLLFKTPIIELPGWSILPTFAGFLWIIFERYRRNL